MSEIWLITYIAAWGITLLRYRKNHNRYGLGAFIISLYLIFACSSYLLYKNPFYAGTWKPLQLFPFVYLFTMLYIAILPILKYNDSGGLQLIHPNDKILKTFTYTIIISSLLQIPNILLNLVDGIQLLFLNIDNAAEIYADRKVETLETTRDGINIFLFNTVSIIANIFSDFCIFLYFYYHTLDKKCNKFITYSLVITMVVSILRPLSQANRTEGILTLFTIISTYLLFKPYINGRSKEKLKVIIISLLSIIIIPIIIITVSRFYFSDEGSLASVERYAGECNLYFNNFGLDNNGTREGERTCNIFKQLIGFQNVAPDVRSLRAKYPQLHINDTYFSTFVGDFTIDFGPIIPVFIFVFFSYLFCTLTKARNNNISFHQLIILYFVVIICTKGGMYLFPFSFTDNLKIIAFAFSYLIFRASSNNKNYRL